MGKKLTLFLYQWLTTLSLKIQHFAKIEKLPKIYRWKKALIFRREAEEEFITLLAQLRLGVYNYPESFQAQLYSYS